MMIGFLLGISIDIFYDSLGLHAFSMVLVAYLRNYWLAVITPQGGYDAGTLPVLEANGIKWFLLYTIPLIFIHHFVLFFWEVAGFRNFWFTFLKIISSMMFTLVVILILQFTFGSRRRI
jgi:cell shape-determining protein MreD